MARTLSEIDKDIAETEEALRSVQGSETEVYARIVGYYRSLKNWNKGKKDEFTHRKTFVYDENSETENTEMATGEQATGENGPSLSGKEAVNRYKVFVRKTCPNCPPVKEYLAESGLSGTVVDVDTQEGLKEAMGLNVFSAPTVILYQGDTTVGTAHSVHELDAFLGLAA